MLLDMPINKAFVLGLRGQLSTSPAESLTPFCQTTHSQYAWQQGSHSVSAVSSECYSAQEWPRSCPETEFSPVWGRPSQHLGTCLPSCLMDFPCSCGNVYRAPLFPIQSCLQFNLGVNQITVDRHLKDQVGRLANHSSRSRIPCQASKFI